MSYINTIKSTHPNYDFAADELLMVRDCVEGELAVKKSRNVKKYLPDPRYVDNSYDYAVTAQARAEYESYLNGAEYDDFVSSTLDAWVGLMDLDKAVIQLPESISYLLDDADGDGTSLIDFMQECVSNAFQTKYHGVLVEYGNSGADTSELTKQQAKAAGIKVELKQYPRESIVDWDFSIVNGIKQLSFLKLCEKVTERSEDGLKVEEFENYLVLRLDDTGHYTQQKFYKVGSVGSYDGDIVMPKANGQRLNFLPFAFASDTKITSGRLPRQAGTLAKIARKAISRMRTSADLNRALSIVGIPTVFTNGWKHGDAELFKEINEGRTGIVFGAANNLPGDVTFKLEAMAGGDSALFEKMDRNQRESQALGARFSLDDAEGAKTATEVSAQNAKETAMLVSAANASQGTFTLLLEIAALFEGQPNAEVIVDLDKDFSSQKIDVAERNQIIQEHLSGLYSKEVALKMLISGGVVIDETSDIFE